MKPVAHGGDLGEAMRRFPDAPRPWLDLSTGINPVPYPLPDLANDAWPRLPSRVDHDALIAAAAWRISSTESSASTRRSRLRGMRSAEPMKQSAVSGSAPNR